MVEGERGRRRGEGGDVKVEMSVKDVERSLKVDSRKDDELNPSQWSSKQLYGHDSSIPPHTCSDISPQHFSYHREGRTH